MQLLNVTCPSCGASVINRLNSRRVTCAYCGSQFILDGEDADGFLKTVKESPPEDEALDGLSMSAFAARVCEEFLSSSDPDRFKDTPKIRNGLGIGDGETVYLIHDDTVLKSGKNGFAVTSRGLYCRGMFEPAEFLDWNAFAKTEEPELADSYISCGRRKVCYFTDNKEVLSDLAVLYERLHRHAGK